MPRWTIIRVVTLREVIIRRIRRVLHETHRIKMYIGQTFGDVRRVPNTFPFRLVTNLSYDSWPEQFVRKLQICLIVSQLVIEFFKGDWLVVCPNCSSQFLLVAAETIEGMDDDLFIT